MAGLDDTFDLAAVWLSAAADALDLTPARCPDRAYVSPGPPAFDCEQLTAFSFTLTEAATSTPGGPLAPAQRVHRGAVLLLEVQLSIVRCVPVIGEGGDAPPVADLAASALTLNRDVWALWNGLAAELRRDGSELAARCDGAFRVGAQALTASGGFGGWVVAYRVPIAGFDLAAGS